MIDALSIALTTPGLTWLMLVSLAAGLVYGFAGFGAALIYMPLTTIFLAPPVAVATLSVTAIGSLFTVLPQAFRDANKRAVAYLLGFALFFTPVGLWVLRTTDPDLVRWAVSAIVFGTLAVLIMGWRYKAEPGPKIWAGVGSCVGIMGGSTGLNGPVLILFQLAGKDEVAQVRANSIVVLTVSGLSYLPFLQIQGALPEGAVALGLLMAGPYAVGGYLGRRLFNPDLSTLYRRLAYAIILVAGVLGLPIFV